jgi:signal transduction histidine kinase
MNESTNQRINELRQLVADLRAERLASELLRQRLQRERRQRQTSTGRVRSDDAA